MCLRNKASKNSNKTYMWTSLIEPNTSKKDVKKIKKNNKSNSTFKTIQKQEKNF